MRANELKKIIMMEMDKSPLTVESFRIKKKKCVFWFHGDLKTQTVLKV